MRIQDEVGGGGTFARSGQDLHEQFPWSRVGERLSQRATSPLTGHLPSSAGPSSHLASTGSSSAQPNRRSAPARAHQRSATCPPSKTQRPGAATTPSAPTPTSSEP